MPYSNRERQIILTYYIKNNLNCRSAIRNMIEDNPGMHVPSRKTFTSIYRKFQETSNLQRQKRTVSLNENAELNILLAIEENPNTSIRNISQTLRRTQENIQQTSYGKVQRTLKKYHLKPFKIKPTTKLTQRQKDDRVTFCRLILDRININHNFLKTVLWTDESTFSTSGLFNRKNTREWARENPHSYREFRFQGRQSVNVWCGILGDRVIGPYFFDTVLNGDRYLEFLQNNLEEYLEDLPLNLLQNIIFQQDGAPPHNIHGVLNYMNERFPEWIGRNAPIKWPANSPDLTPMDAFLWGYLKNRINNYQIESLNHLKDLIRNEINDLNQNNREFITNSLQKLRRTLTRCIEENGGPVEHLYI